MAVEVLAATPLVSATALARATAMSIKSATELLDSFVAEAIVVEVAHRPAQRLIELAGVAPVGDDTAPPPPVAHLERPANDYAPLEAAMAHCEVVIRSTR